MQRRKFIQMMLGSIAIASPISLLAKNLNIARMSNTSEKFRLVLDLEKKVKFQTFLLDSPFRIIIDIDSLDLVNTFNNLYLESSPIKNIRTAIKGNGTRIVLEMKNPVDINSFELPISSSSNFRIVFDMTPSKIKSTTLLANSGEKSIDNKVSLKPHLKRDIIVVIDAGHGGKDPGAVGKGGAMEKDVVLTIATMLKNRINRQQGFKAHLVRDKDYFVPLRKRVDIARKHNADVFVSIHADAAPRISANGASVYALSERGATSTTARFLAKSENSVDLLGAKSLLNLSDKDPMLAGVILDMSMNSTISSSLSLGSTVLGNLQSVTKLHNKRTEQAAFAVLKSPDIPSILIETGFISNPSDSKKLTNILHQRKLSESIFSGLHEHFYKYPPADTYVEWSKNNKIIS